MLVVCTRSAYQSCAIPLRFALRSALFISVANRVASVQCISLFKEKQSSADVVLLWLFESCSGAVKVAF